MKRRIHAHCHNTQDVVHLIRSNLLRTELLVASESVDDWYKEHDKEFSFANCDRCVLRKKALAFVLVWLARKTFKVNDKRAC